MGTNVKNFKRIEKARVRGSYFYWIMVLLSYLTVGFGQANTTSFIVVVQNNKNQMSNEIYQANSSWIQESVIWKQKREKRRQRTKEGNSSNRQKNLCGVEAQHIRLEFEGQTKEDSIKRECTDAKKEDCNTYEGTMLMCLSETCVQKHGTEMHQH